MKTRNPATQEQRGFTIIELMIATAVLGIILLLATTMMISIGNLLSKGLNQSRTQDTARSILSEVSQHLQLNDTTPVQGSGPANILGHPVTVQSYCIGSHLRYSYLLGYEEGSGTDPGGIPRTAHVLWRDDNTDNNVSDVVSSTSGCQPIDVTKASFSHENSSGTELVASNSRLSQFCISGSSVGSCNPNSSPYNVVIAITYGDSDLLINPTSTSPTCKGGINTGDQFCSTASLSTTVVQRL